MRTAAWWGGHRNVDLHGMPSWTDLATPDIGASKDFYCRLFGWDVYTLSSDSFGDYEIFFDGTPELGVAGAHPLLDDTEPPSWTCYFRVHDVDACVRAALAAGGQLRVDPLDVAHIARIAQLADDQGAEFAIWQPGSAGETRVIGDRSAAGWVELASRDTAAARRFYEAVFGWSAAPLDEPLFDYTKWGLNGQPVAGLIRMDHRWPADYPGEWAPFFETEDCDGTTARATEMGAQVRFPPTQIEDARFAALTDPTGVRFGLVSPAPAADAPGGAAR